MTENVEKIRKQYPLMALQYDVKVVRGLATKRYEFSKYHIFKRIKHVCVEQHLYVSDILEFF